MQEKFKKYLETILVSVPGVNSVALLSSDGLPITTVTAENYNDDIVMAVTSAFNHLSETIKDEIKFKAVKELIVRGTDGIILLNYINEIEALLYISAYNEAKLGILIMESQRAIANIIGEL